MGDTDKTHEEPSALLPEGPSRGEDPVSFSDRAIAFLILILPFSWSIDKAQELLEDKVSQFVNHMVVFIGLIVFLVLVGWLSKRIHVYRKMM